MDGHPWTSGDVWIRHRTICGCDQEQMAEQAQLEQQHKREERSRRIAWAQALQRAGLEGWLAHASFETYQANTPERAQHLRLCKQYTDALLHNDLDKPWLVLYGQYGTGKTHLAAGVIREALGQNWRQCYFRPWLSYLRRLLDSFDAEAEEKTSDIARELAAGRLVAIDDIDNDRANVSKSGFAETELFRALDDRYRGELPTILTFNRHPLEMTPWLGVAGVDRVMQYSYAVVGFKGASWRSGQDWDFLQQAESELRGDVRSVVEQGGG
jgi:DNA replication protein DnaC